MLSLYKILFLCLQDAKNIKDKQIDFNWLHLEMVLE